MFTGHSPFKEKTEYLVFRKILDQNLYFPEVILNSKKKYFPPEAQDLVVKLLVHDPSKRLGANRDYSSIRNHSFFKGVDFKNLIEPPFKKFLKVKFSLKPKIFFNDDISLVKAVEKIIKEGLILKKKTHKAHYNKRKLILYNTPKIEYIDPSKNVVKVKFIFYFRE